jgi:hypothetical protein
VLFDSGRPVLIAPREAPTSIGTRVCCAWNGTAESAAADRGGAALPAPRAGGALLYADEYQRRGPPVEGIRAYSAGTRSRPRRSSSSRKPRTWAPACWARRADFGADLLCMGAYSHSRLRQLILGGVTRHVLENSDMPVLMCR